MCSSKVPGDKSPRLPHENSKEETSLTSSHEVKRPAIFPGSSQEKIEIEGMISSAKAEQQRLKPEKKPKDESEEVQPVEKKRTIDSAQKGEFEQLLIQVHECFGAKPEIQDDLNSIASFCFERATFRLQGLEYVKNEEIVKIYQVFFGTALKPISQQELSRPLNLRAPHPVYVFMTLFDCVEALEAYPSFRDAIDAREKCLEIGTKKDPKTPLARFLRLDVLNRQRVLPLVLEQDPNFENIFNNCLVYSTRDLFGSNNIHSAYAFRGKDFQPKWIFKLLYKFQIMD